MTVEAATAALPGDASVAIARQAIHDRRAKVVGYALLLRDAREPEAFFTVGLFSIVDAIAQATSAGSWTRSLGGCRACPWATST